MIYKFESYDKMSSLGAIHYSALKKSIRLDEFRTILEDDLGVPTHVVERAVSGCKNCWNDLRNILDKNFNDSIVRLNTYMQTLDVEGKLKDSPASQLAHRRKGTFKTKEDVLKYLEGIRVFNSITISFK